MPEIALDLQDGLYFGGTEYSSKNRWYDANLIRFRNKVISPVGGWVQRSVDTISGITRAMLVWNDLELHSWIALGTHTGLWMQSRSGITTDITPYNFTPGRADALQGGGYGTGGYGRGTWGTRRLDVKDILGASVWSFDNWGENLNAIFDFNGGSHPYEWTPKAVNASLIGLFTAQGGTTNSITLASTSSVVDNAYDGYYVVIVGGTGKLGESRLIQNFNGTSKIAGVLQAWTITPDNTTQYRIEYSGQIANAPTGVGLIVTDERHLMIIGANGNPLQVAWSDQEDNTNWNYADITSEAGYLNLVSVSELMCIVKVRGGILILSRTDAFFGTYQGSAFVYGFQRVGSNCGVVGRKAICVINGVAYWRGVNGFYKFNGYVLPLQCDLWELLKTDTNNVQSSKFWGMGNSAYDEVWWFDMDASNSEITRYVSMNVNEGHWSKGVLSRGAGSDFGSLRFPVMTSIDGKVFQHETGTTYDSVLPYLESGPLELQTDKLGNISPGNNTLTVKQYIPDEKTSGQVTVTFKGKFWPNLTEYTKGPFAADSPQGVFFNARQVSVRFDAIANADFRIGSFRFNVVMRGKR